MANRYANLTGSKWISEEYPMITEGFDAVQADMDGKAPLASPALTGNPTAPTADEGDDSASIATTAYADRAAGTVQSNLEAHEADEDVHVTEADHIKLDSIEAGAEVNQSAFAQINDVEADDPRDGVTIAGGTGITISTNPGAKTVTITATGEATPGAHGTSHTEFGSDPIPNATDTEGGLMSADDKAALDGLAGGLDDLAGSGRTTETVKGNADAIAAINADLLKIGNPQRAKYKKSVAQDIPSTVWTYVEWDTKVYDTNNFVSPANNQQIVINEAGTYLIVANIAFSANGVGLRNIFIERNGQYAAYQTNNGFNAGPTATTTQSIATAIEQCEVGDIITIRCNQDSGATLQMNTNCVFSIIKLAGYSQSYTYPIGRFFAPTQIKKLGTNYFVVDHDHHRIAYSNNIDRDLRDWTNIDYEFAGPHSIASDGDIYVVDNTGYNQVLVFNSSFRRIQTIYNLGNRPHKVVYDTGKFYVLSSGNQTIYCYSKVGGVLVEDYHKVIPYLPFYVRSIKVIDSKMYFVGNNGVIYAANYLSGNYELLESHTVPSEFAQLVDIERFNGEWFISAMGNPEVPGGEPSILARGSSLANIAAGAYTNMYSVANMMGKPYLFEVFDGNLNFGEVGTTANSIISLNTSYVPTIRHRSIGVTEASYKRSATYPV